MSARMHIRALHSRHPGRRPGLLAAALTLALGACGGGGGSASDPAPRLSGSGNAPLQLGNARNGAAATGVDVLGEIDEAEARRGIETYRINKSRAKGPYRLVGADLNADGTPEAVVLFQGKDWCAHTGCSLAVLQSGEHGYRPISRTVRVKAPVAVAEPRTGGWHDLLVYTGGGPAPVRRVRLRFSANGYSRNAMQETEVPLGTAIRSQIIFPARGEGTATSRAGPAQGSPASNP